MPGFLFISIIRTLTSSNKHDYITAINFVRNDSMRVASSYSTERNGIAAVDSAYKTLLEKLGSAPGLILFFSSTEYNTSEINKRLSDISSGAFIHGSTSCLGVMTENGFHGENGFGLGMFGILDEAGAYGVGSSIVTDDPRSEASIALKRALKAAGREGEVPAMVLIASSPGSEELVIQGIDDVLGPRVPVIGGSSGDNSISGKWGQFANGEVFANAVVVTVFFPSTEIVFGYHSGYEPTKIKGVVTKSTGRTVFEINGRPAARVYNEWTGGLISDFLLTGGNILSTTTFSPLGLKSGTSGKISYYRLSHIQKVYADGSLALFANIPEGSEITLMSSNGDTLVRRAGELATAFMETYSVSRDDVIGAMFVYCAGCMLAIPGRMNDVVSGINSAIDGVPFIGTYTFGEQGCFAGGENRHGNLMISTLLFTGRPNG